MAIQPPTRLPKRKAIIREPINPSSPSQAPIAPTQIARLNRLCLVVTDQGQAPSRLSFSAGLDRAALLRSCLLYLSWKKRTSPQPTIFLPFTYKGAAIDIKQVGRELGVRYVLEGSVRKSGSRIRITAQLIEAETGNHIWAERYDRELEDILISRTRSPAPSPGPFGQP